MPSLTLLGICVRLRVYMCTLAGVHVYACSVVKVRLSHYRGIVFFQLVCVCREVQKEHTIQRHGNKTCRKIQNYDYRSLVSFRANGVRNLIFPSVINVDI